MAVIPSASPGGGEQPLMADRSSRRLMLTARQSRQLSIIEDSIELGIQREEEEPTSNIKRLQKAGETLINTKGVLLLVVVLNCVDCLLVLAELMLDVHFVVTMVGTAERTIERFNKILLERYPGEFDGFPLHDIHLYYNKILDATMIWDNSTDGYSYTNVPCDLERTSRSVESFTDLWNMSSVVREMEEFVQADDPHFLDEESDSAEEAVSHVLHKISISILSVLVIYTATKVFCMGVHFFKRKLEMFDAVVVLTSFILDIVFIKGLTNYRVELFIISLVFMIPWRVIRVLNSLIIAVKDNYHLRLKILYRHSKYQRHKISSLKDQTNAHRNRMAALERLCELNGIRVVEATLEKLDDLLEKDSALFGSCFGKSSSERNLSIVNCEDLLYKPSPKDS